MLPGPKAATNAATPILYPTLSRNCRRVPSLSLSLTVIHAYTRTTFPHSFLSLSFLLSLSLSLLPHYSSLCGALNFPPSLQTFPFAFACFLPSFAPRNKKKRASGNSLQQGASSYRCCRLRTYVLKRPFFPPFYLPYKVVNEISRSVVVCVCVCAHRPPPVCTGRDEDLS